ncbi:hypothetical protein GGR16_002623 [Chelatococcus caeni]|uniref:Tail fiber protein n=1 Tax=Chelatococcus caeni TaxID=1348468 RepID=A0A840C265_9HYPH|nr:hypothetical protein [Chelatococcus caeni]MBB4017589.1 hypothetical protein [Chelatococcus caeni]
MPYLQPYEPDYSFFGFQNANPQSPLPGDRLDAQLEDVAFSLEQVIAFLQGFTTAEGKLAPGSVGPDQLAPSISLSFEPPAPWQPNTTYTTRSTVFYANDFYIAKKDHVSGAVFDPSNWNLLADFSQILVGAEAAKVAAEAAAVSAAGSASAAGGSATAAATAASNAGNSATAAAASESAAATSETNAAASAATASDAAAVAQTAAVQASDAATAAATSAVVAEQWAEAAQEGALPDGSVTTAKLALGAVDSDRLADGSVTTAKLAMESVDSDRLGNGSVTASKLALGAVGNGQLADMAEGTIKARAAGGDSGPPQDLSVSDVLNMIGTTHGDLIFRGEHGWERLAPGGVGQVLATFGEGGNPAWIDPPSGGGKLDGVGNIDVITGGTTLLRPQSDDQFLRIRALEGFGGFPYTHNFDLETGVAEEGDFFFIHLTLNSGEDTATVNFRNGTGGAVLWGVTYSGSIARYSLCVVYDGAAWRVAWVIQSLA